MKKSLLYTLAAVIGLGGLAETAPVSAAEGQTAPRSLDQLRERLRAEAAASFKAGAIETVTHRRYHYRKHAKRKRWCGYRKYYGYRCYYTPWVFRKIRGY